MSGAGNLSKIAQMVADLDEDDQAEVLVKEALEQGVDPLQIINDGVVAGLQRVSAKYDEGEYFLAELTMAGQLSKKLIALITPYLPAAQAAEKKKVVLGTVKGDMHDLGKNLVGLMLTCSGYEVHDLGRDVATMDLIKKVREVKADVLGLSSLMVTTMANHSEVIQYLKDLGLRDQVKVIIGGGPTTEEFARSVGADGWAPDAAKAVAAVDRLVGIRR